MGEIAAGVATTTTVGVGVRGPPSLKSKLKSQIAALHRAKKLFLAKKEAQERRLILDGEREERRRVEEEDARRRASIREAERMEGERQGRRAEVGRCLSDVVVAGVERRMEWEGRNPGAHYAAGEALESIVASIERADGEERASSRARKREGARRRREDGARKEGGGGRRREAWACLCDVIDAVEAGATPPTTTTPTMAPRSPSPSHGGYRYRPPHTTAMPPPHAHAAAMQIVHPTTMTTTFGGYHHNHAVTIVPSSPFHASMNGAHAGTMARPIVNPHGAFSTSHFAAVAAAAAAAARRMAYPAAIDPRRALHSQPPAATHRMPALHSCDAIVGRGSSSTAVHLARPHPPPPPQIRQPAPGQ